MSGQNRIKAQAREHERFRRICVRFAQGIHRVDMRLRLGLLQDPEVIEKQIAREAAEAQARKHKLEAPTVRTEAEQKAYEQETTEEKKRIKEKTKPRIRPLSEAKAIDTGANFVSESFLFAVGFGLIIFESWRRERKETTRREDVAERIGELEETERSSRRALVELEKEILRLRAKTGEGKHAKGRILPKELWEAEQQEEEEAGRPKGWLSWLPWPGSKQAPEALRSQPAKTASSLPGEVEQVNEKGTASTQVPSDETTEQALDPGKEIRSNSQPVTTSKPSDHLGETSPKV